MFAIRKHMQQIMFPLVKILAKTFPVKSTSCLSAPHYFVRMCSESVKDRNVEELFLRRDVQRLLKDMTGFNLDKIFKRTPVDKLRSPKYVFLTDEDLQMSLRVAKKKAQQKLSMPPVMNPREDEVQILSKDPAMQGFSQRKYLFTDISAGFSDRNRLIVVREPNGILRRAYREERYRMNQIYFPVHERHHTTPKMFEPEHLQEVLERHDYQFVLDRACLQFEPDDPLYIQITHKTYDHIAQHKKFDQLRCTRHFGPMAFYYAFNDQIDPLLQDMITRHFINDGAKLVKLYHILQLNESKDLTGLTDIQIIKDYIVHHSHKRHHLETSLKNYEDLTNPDSKSNEACNQNAVSQ